MNEQKKCLVTEAMEILGKKWVIIILYHLLSGPKRFYQLEDDTDASGRLLSERLKELEAAGMVTRTIYAEVPPRVEYQMTEKGREVEPIIREIYAWASKWLV
ncbi:winged helix-turn-helix transcriptional regulator [Paenibacillus alkalitolerans]|uniref:winged helix-turn-helix transcriptional regulator n=1 Tax=Paenibacillus alkalitolerans TaxID=2799335 RepID=UPI0018F7CAE6|nr:helix-turn-helix domain-containing protein [Paenibacillus alkalitolerans]